MTREEYLKHKDKSYLCKVNDKNGNPIKGYGTVCGYKDNYLIVGFNTNYEGCISSFTRFVHLEPNNFKSYKFIKIPSLTYDTEKGMVVLSDDTVLNLAQQSEEGNKVINQYIKSRDAHDDITLSLRSIKNDLKEILSHYPEWFYFGQIHFNLLLEVVKDLGWVMDSSYVKIDDREHQLSTIFHIPGKNFSYSLKCGWFDPMSSLEKIINDENTKGI